MRLTLVLALAAAASSARLAPAAILWRRRKQQDEPPPPPPAEENLSDRFGAWFSKQTAKLPGQQDDPRRQQAASLMQRRRLQDCQKAVELLQAAHADNPDDVDGIGLELAQALNAVMRIRTHSNTLHITEMLDTPEHRKIWSQLGPQAVSLAKAATKARPDDADAFSAYVDAYFFCTSAKGVLRAAVGGDGLVFKGNAVKLMKRFPSYDGGVGYCYMGAFYLMAPWPLCNADQAIRHLGMAHKVAPHSRRNNYYLGVAHYRLGRPAEAAPYFRKAIACKPNSVTEADFGEWVLARAKEALAKCEAAAEG